MKMQSSKNNSTPTNESVALVAHDLQGIIRQISSLNEMLKTHLYPITNSDINRIFNYLDQVCLQGQAITADLMEIDELEMFFNLPSEVSSLNHLIREKAEMYLLHTNSKCIEFQLLLPERQFFFQLNRSKFIRVLDNLFFNALRFTPNKGCIQITLSDKNGNARIEIRDSGPGIPEEIHPSIFKKYPSYGLKHENSQSGLGLYIAKKIIELHKGTIGFTSGESGTSFFIELKNGIIL
jgi:two-component system sensor histidine kinase VicK